MRDLSVHGLRCPRVSWNQPPVDAEGQPSLGESEVTHMDCLCAGCWHPPTQLVVQGSPMNSFSHHSSHPKKVLSLSLFHKRQKECKKLASHHMAGKGKSPDSPPGSLASESGPTAFPVFSPPAENTLVVFFPVGLLFLRPLVLLIHSLLTYSSPHTLRHSENISLVPSVSGGASCWDCSGHRHSHRPAWEQPGSQRGGASQCSQG